MSLVVAEPLIFKNVNVLKLPLLLGGRDATRGQVPHVEEASRGARLSGGTPVGLQGVSGWDGQAACSA